MKGLFLCSLLCVAIRTAGSMGSAGAFSTSLSHVISLSTSGEGVQSPAGEDTDFDDDQDPSGAIYSDAAPLKAQHVAKGGDQVKGRRKGRKTKGHRRTKTNGTTVHIPSQKAHTPAQRHQTHSASTTTVNPCTTSHQDYCIHGQCIYIENLREPVCVCLKGYDGERCGVHLLETGQREPGADGAEMVQTVLVIVAVVLSTISCCAIALISCVHYKTQKNFKAAYLGPNDEREKLQKNGNIIV